MISNRQLKTKIRTIGSIKQMTRAMEMVAGVKMRKAQLVALRARPFAKKALSLLRDLLSHPEQDIFIGKNPLFQRGRKGTTCLVVVTSDRGLCGAFNSQVLRKSLQWKLEHPDAEIVAVGKKAKDFFARRGIALAHSFIDFSEIAVLSDVIPLADWILSSYQEHRYHTILFCSTHFVSALAQRVEFTEILPLGMEELEKTIQRIVPKTGKFADLASPELQGSAGVLPSFLEPSPKEIFDTVAKNLVKTEILHLVFESNASEHSARMLAMKNATENAQELQEELQLALNKARQASITQELSEIASAKEALASE